MRVENETASPYFAPPQTVSDDWVISEALRILGARLRHDGVQLSSPQEVKAYLAVALAGLEREEFHALFLDAHNRMIQDFLVAQGTVTTCEVYPREVVKEALFCNAVSVILAHNHPSGEAEPSEADKKITARLKLALGLLDIRLLDHIVVGGTNTYSFSEHSLI